MEKQLYNLEAEQSVLGSLVCWPESFDDIAGTVRAEDFYKQDHQIIFQVIADMHESHDQIDVVTVGARIDERHGSKISGGIAYIGTLALNTPTSYNVRAYAKVVADRATERRLIKAAQEVMQAVHSVGDTEEKIATAQQLFGAVIDHTVKDVDPKPIKSFLTSAVDEIDKAFQSGEAVHGVTTGLKDLDDMTNGYEPGELIVIAGRPSMGKSTIALNGAARAAIKGTPSLFFTMEMSGKRLAMREMSRIGNIQHNKFRNGKFEDQDWPRLTSAVGQLSEMPLFIDDSANLSLHQLRAKARRMRRKHDIGLIVIDYLQLMDMQADTRNEAIGVVTRGLKVLAGELHIPIVVLSQLNRSLENRPNKRPRMADLRESGAIEQDADKVVFIYRDEVYDPDSAYKGLAEIIVAKNRDGEIGTVKSVFNGAQCCFQDLIIGDWPQQVYEKPKRAKRGFA